ncbi:MAG: transketolase [Candidatus Eremiobacteraeota bacterium]|nr:transketolase [Candidatus Eremiobacteraeota bacterium]
MSNSPEVEQRINTIRMLSIDAVQKANSGHPGAPLGAAAMTYAIFARHLRYNPKDPKWFDRDRFVLSAGHASMLLYSMLYLTGYGLTLDDLKAFRQLHSRTPGHPEEHHTPGVEVTTGPLGQGLANAVGLAMAEAHRAATFSRDETICDHFTYCIASDGDMMEGVTHEACSLAGHLKLGKLIVLYDDNKVSLAGPTSVTFDEDVCARFAAYGWHTEVVDQDHANDVAAIDAAIEKAKKHKDAPSLIAVKTTIGYGSPLAGTFKVHGEPLGPDNVKKTKEFFGWPLEPDFYVPDEVTKFWQKRAEEGAKAQTAWQSLYDGWKRAHADLAAQLERMLADRLPEKLPWPTFNAENGQVATRDAGGTVMNAIAKSFPELFGGSADLDPSTKTYMKDCGEFEPGSYGGRNVHFGVREHGMGAIVNGIEAHGGLLPYGATFFNFLDYMKPAVRLAAINRSHCIFIYTHDSFFLGEDGPTHQPIEQLATLRATPNLAVIRPADSVETLEAWKVMVRNTHHPYVLVLTRQKLPYLGERSVPIDRGAYVLKDSSGTPDLILIATGSEVSLALDAAKLLEAKGTAVRVVSMPCTEFFDEQDEEYRESVLPSAVRARMSIEAAATLGWHKYVGDHGICYGVDRFGESAPAAAIAKDLGFTPERVAEVASGILARV